MRRALAFLCSCGIVAIAFAASRDASANSTRDHWVRIARDPNYDVAIDSVAINATLHPTRYKMYRVYEVWFRTDHKLPREYRGKPFNREIVHSMVLCDSLWYKVMSVDLSMGDERPISQQRTTWDDVHDQPWRRVTLGTAEEIAARAACFYGRKRLKNK
jgi:hypothetical protein